MKRPNILFIMTDQQRYDALGANGNPVIQTPALDALAKESANFSNFFIQAPVCVPSRQTFFTGRYPHSHKNRVNYTMLAPSETLMQRRLQREGYRTGFVGKLHYYPPTRDFALSTGFDRGLLHDAGPTDEYSDYVAWLRGQGFTGDYRACRGDCENPYVSALPEELHESAWCGRESRAMLREMAASEEPFFLFSSYWKPHSSFEVPRPYAEMYDGCEIPLPHMPGDEEMRALVPPVRTLAERDGAFHNRDSRETVLWQYRAYYAAVSQIDAEVGKTLCLLDELGLRDNTVVVFASDHGDLMHEHGMIDKNVFFDAAIHTPFMIRFPGHVMPGEYGDLTESTDVLATLWELCGLSPPRQQGRSFARPITSGACGSPYRAREYVFAENIIPEVIRAGALDMRYVPGAGVGGILHPEAKMVRSKQWKFNYYPGSGEELYDLVNDPGETRNRAEDPACAGVRAAMKDALLFWLCTADETDQIAPDWYMVLDGEGDYRH